MYNWQFVHCVDFWAIVLGRACSSESGNESGEELRPLVYPLVQVAMGAIRYALPPYSHNAVYKFYLTGRRIG